MLFGEYDEMRVKFSTDPENKQIFKSMIGIADALKLLEAILRYTELVLFEVKRDKFMRRSERNYINWAEEQRSKLFAKNPFKVFSVLIYFIYFFHFFHSFQFFIPLIYSISSHTIIHNSQKIQTRRKFMCSTKGTSAKKSDAYLTYN